MNRAAFFLFAALCVLPVPISRTGPAYAKEPLAPLPPIFGVELDGPPPLLLARLKSLGYRSVSWTLEPPFSKRVYKAARDDDPFAEVALDICNRPARVVRMRVRGQGTALYETVKDRFHFGVKQWDNNGPPGRYGRYTGQFAGGTRVTLQREGDDSVLEIESGIEECRAAFAEDREVLARTQREAEAAGKASRGEVF